ncbi:MAG: hypothetical protein QGD94_03725, partial [Planctomycetia bacterium]|nr:hypothetical protein [Planctomycetia bacterium]
MAEEQREIQSINWKKVFGFLEIMRSFRMAIHPAKIVLCLLGLGAMFGLGLALDQISGFATAEGEESFCYNVTTLYETLIAYDVDLDMGVVASIEQLAMRPVVVAGDSIELAMEYWGNHFWFALIYSVISLAIW